MAWIEVRILAAKLVYAFDFDLVDKTMDWDRLNQCFTLWEKPELVVNATHWNRH